MDSISPRVTYIYGLVDPRTSQLRYIGKSNNPRVRYTKHVNEKAISHKCSWIQQLRSVGLVPWLIILDIIPVNDWKHYEADWITCFRPQLTNIANGGVGMNAVTDEIRHKMSLSKKGRTPHNKGKATSPEARKKQSIAAKLKYERMTDDERAALNTKMSEIRDPSAALKGWHHTEEARLKIGVASKGNKHTAILNRDEVLEIVALINQKEIQLKDIGAMYGVGIQTISNIKHGRSYADWSGVNGKINS